MSYILGLFAIISGWLFVERSKRKSAEALNENLETKEKVDDIKAKQQVNEAGLVVEEERRKDANENANQEKAKPVADPDVIEFFNKLK